VPSGRCLRPRDSNGRIWPPGHWAIHAGQVRVVIGSPLPISGLTRHDVARLRDQAREAVCSAYRDLALAVSAKACHRR